MPISSYCSQCGGHLEDGWFCPACDCSDCCGKGWDVYNAGGDFLLGEIQRCDSCQKYETDFDAACAAEREGFVIGIDDLERFPVLHFPKG